METKSKRRVSVFDLCLIPVFVAVIAAMAQIRVPVIPPVPFTMQTFAIPLTGAVLGAKKGAVAVAVYLLLGIIGVPVFNGFTGGPAMIVGPTGGFLLAFPLFAFIVGITAGKGKRIWLGLGLVIGTITLFAFGGIVWPLLRGFASSLQTAFFVWVAPFLFGDLIKITMVFVIAPEIRKVLSNIRSR